MLACSATEMRGVSTYILNMNIVDDVKKFLYNSNLLIHKLNLAIRVLAKREF